MDFNVYDNTRKNTAVYRVFNNQTGNSCFFECTDELVTDFFNVHGIHVPTFIRKQLEHFVNGLDRHTTYSHNELLFKVTKKEDLTFIIETYTANVEGWRG